MHGRTDSPPAAEPTSRIIGIYEGRRPGRTIIGIGAMHGNEPAGVDAIQRVLTDLRRRRIDMAGTLVGVVGNLQAVAARRRFIERDLNRGWTPEDCRRVAEPCADEGPEDLEQRALMEVFAPLGERSPQPLVFLDLHSTSGPAAPFSIIPDVARNRELALQLPIPTVLGLAEIVQSAMLGHLVNLGHMGIAVEGGQHEDPQTADRLEAVIWLSMVAMGNLRRSQVPGYARLRRRLRAACAGLPAAVRILHRHGLGDDERFEMVPGFENFSPVRRGQLLARGRHGAVEAPRDGLVMLPRYQGQGSDGFFLATRVTRRWLALSAAARRSALELAITRWPGLHAVAGDPNRMRYAGATPPALLSRVLRLLGFHGVRPRPRGLEFFRFRP